MLQVLHPKRSIKISVLAVVFTFSCSVLGQNPNCFNPNRRPGYCISVFQCPALLSLVTQQPVNNEDRRFLVESQCEDGLGEPPQVCCSSDTGFLSGPIAESITSFGVGSGDIIPSPPTCGLQRSANEVPQDNTALTFPWLAHLAYVRDDSRTSINCGGALINSRYVLTAAHCVKGEIERSIGPLYSIHLGVSDLVDDIVNCSSSSSNKCVEIGIEEVIPHELYNSDAANPYHDIALIRLSSEIQFTDSIRPICLPATVSLTKSTSETEVLIVGWGASVKGTPSASRSNTQIRGINQNDCQTIFNKINITITNSQICSAGRDPNDSCSGDSGGPLMTLVHDHWVIEGISSFNYNCGSSEPWPGVYTRVSGYGNWIRRHMRP